MVHPRGRRPIAVPLSMAAMVFALLGAAAMITGSGHAAHLTPPHAAANSLVPTPRVVTFDFSTPVPQVATVTVVNTGTTPITITGTTPTATGLTTSPWQVIPGDEDCKGAILQPTDGYCVVSLRFVSFGKPVDGFVTISASDGTNVQSTVSTSADALDNPDMNPKTLAYGNVNIGTTSPAQPATITAAPSNRQFMMMSAFAVDSPTTPGTAADYQRTSNTCDGVILAVTDPAFPSNCQINEAAKPQVAGSRPAFLDVTYCDPFDFDVIRPPTGGSGVRTPPPGAPPGHELVCGHGDGSLFYASHMLVSLSSTGVAIPPPANQQFTPTLIANPPLTPAGRTTQVTGTGFPGNTTVTFALVPLNSPTTIDLTQVPGVTTATTDNNGTFTQVMVTMPHTAAGQYEILATAPSSSGPVVATVGFRIAPGTLQPPKFVTRH